jgi:hypothetical protein
MITEFRRKDVRGKYFPGIDLGFVLAWLLGRTRLRHVIIDRILFVFHHPQELLDAIIPCVDEISTLKVCSLAGTVLRGSSQRILLRSLTLDTSHTERLWVYRLCSLNLPTLPHMFPRLYSRRRSLAPAESGSCRTYWPSTGPFNESAPMHIAQSPGNRRSHTGSTHLHWLWR